jgi:hypothetical protein
MAIPLARCELISSAVSRSGLRACSTAASQVRLLEEQLREVGHHIKRLLTVMIEENAGTNQPPCDAGLVLVSALRRRGCPDGSLQADPGTGLRGIALLCRLRAGYQAKRKKKDRRHASDLQSSPAQRRVLLDNKQSRLEQQEPKTIRRIEGSRPPASTGIARFGWQTARRPHRFAENQKHFDKARRDGTCAKNPLVVAPA